jgi:hypothetical protein
MSDNTGRGPGQPPNPPRGPNNNRGRGRGRGSQGRGGAYVPPPINPQLRQGPPGGGGFLPNAAQGAGWNVGYQQQGRVGSNNRSHGNMLNAAQGASYNVGYQQQGPVGNNMAYGTNRSFSSANSISLPAHARGTLTAPGRRRDDSYRSGAGQDRSGSQASHGRAAPPAPPPPPPPPPAPVELDCLEGEYVPPHGQYVDQTEVPVTWGYSAHRPNCLDCGQPKSDGHLDHQLGCPRPCIRCGHPHQGEPCPKLYVSKNFHRKHGLGGRFPWVIDRLMLDIRVRPNAVEAAELIRRGWAIFKALDLQFEDPKKATKRPADDGFQVTAKRVRLNAVQEADRKQKLAEDLRLMKERAVEAAQKTAEAAAEAVQKAAEAYDNAVKYADRIKSVGQLQGWLTNTEALQADTGAPQVNTEQVDVKVEDTVSASNSGHEFADRSRAMRRAPDAPGAGSARLQQDQVRREAFLRNQRSKVTLTDASQEPTEDTVFIKKEDNDE